MRAKKRMPFPLAFPSLCDDGEDSSFGCRNAAISWGKSRDAQGTGQREKEKACPERERRYGLERRGPREPHALLTPGPSGPRSEFPQRQPLLWDDGLGGKNEERAPSSATAEIATNRAPGARTHPPNLLSSQSQHPGMFLPTAILPAPLSRTLLPSSRGLRSGARTSGDAIGHVGRARVCAPRSLSLAQLSSQTYRSPRTGCSFLSHFFLFSARPPVFPFLSVEPERMEDGFLSH